MENLTAEQKRKLNNINMVRSTVGVAGNLAGAYLAYKKGSGFWGYVGYIILGGIVGGGIAYIATMPFAGKVVNEIDGASKSNTTENK
jgi:hypothetical protein